MSIESEVQSLHPSAMVSLFQLDLSSVNGGVLYFCMGSEVTAGGETLGKVVFNGLEYFAIDIRFEGLETSGVGALPQPVMTLANSDPVISAAILTWGDINGCKLYRYRTFARFLDGHQDADPNAFFGPDVFSVERKASDTKDAISWELSAAVDQEGRMIPGRPAVRGTCLWRYRIWNPAKQDFDYEKAQCPYTGSNYFDEFDQPTTADKDRPSRSLKCCELRFGKGQPWPFGGFPGMRRSL